VTRAELVEVINAVFQDDKAVADVLGGSSGCHDFAEIIATAIIQPGLRCPNWPDHVTSTLDAAINGCGSTNIKWDDEVWDCLDCGLFFTTEAGTPPIGLVD